MASEPLVTSEIEGGLKLLQVLDEAQFGIKAAFWFYHSDQERWRFVIATEDGDRNVEAKYLEAANAIAKARERGASDLLPLDKVKITGAKDPLVKGLGMMIRMSGTGSVRFSRNMINGIYVEDALIHRLAA